MNAVSLSASTELTRSSKVVEVIHKGDLLKSLRGLRELQPWSAPELLAHSHRSVPPPRPLAVHPCLLVQILIMNVMHMYYRVIEE